MSQVRIIHNFVSFLRDHKSMRVTGDINTALRTLCTKDVDIVTFAVCRKSMADKHDVQTNDDGEKYVQFMVNRLGDVVSNFRIAAPPGIKLRTEIYAGGGMLLTEDMYVYLPIYTQFVIRIVYDGDPVDFEVNYDVHVLSEELNEYVKNSIFVAFGIRYAYGYAIIGQQN